MRNMRVGACYFIMLRMSVSMVYIICESVGNLVLHITFKHFETNWLPIWSVAGNPKKVWIFKIWTPWLWCCNTVLQFKQSLNYVGEFFATWLPFIAFLLTLLSASSRLQLWNFASQHLPSVCMFDEFHLAFNFKSKVSRDDFILFWMNVNWCIRFILKRHLNFGLHDILEKLIFWIINIPSCFVTKITIDRV